VGAVPLRWDLEQGQWPLPEGLRGQPTDVIYMVPPLSGDEPSGPMCSLLRNLGEVLEVRSLVYVGSTGVYGDAHGGVVSAQTPRRPQTSRGAKRAQAEDMALELGTERGWNVTLARLPGIYGPGRTLLGRLRGGQYKLVDGGWKWTARVHREDVAMGVEVLMRHGEGGAAYVLCDDVPFQVRTLVRYLTGHLGVALPPEVTLEAYTQERGPFAASFWRTSNRYDNRHIKALPGFSLLYPSFREGYAAILAREGGKGGF
jgi:nucleoside-diphosphate-sugar epimerase